MLKDFGRWDPAQDSELESSTSASNGLQRDILKTRAIDVCCGLAVGRIALLLGRLLELGSNYPCGFVF